MHTARVVASRLCTGQGQRCLPEVSAGMHYSVLLEVGRMYVLPIFPPLFLETLLINSTISPSG